MADLKFLKINGTSYNVGFSTNDYDNAAKAKVDGMDTAIANAKQEAQEAAVAASKVTMNESAGTDSVLKVYTFSQNGKVIGKVNVPKDLVVSGGSVVEVDGVKYLRLSIANQTEPVDIAVTDLVDVYTGSAYITVGSDNAISVNFAALDAALKAETSQTGAAIKANATAAAAAKSAADAAQATANTAKTTAEAAKATAEAAKATADANKTKLDGISEGANKVTASFDDATSTLELTIA